MKNDDPLISATRYYYWKPMAALIRAFELRMYYDLGLRLRGPVLDLGCGDGQMASILRDLKIIETVAGGVDISFGALSVAQKNHGLNWVVQASGNNLPFTEESFSSIISHSVISSIPEGGDQLLTEAYRVLKKDGTLIVTVPSDQFIKVLLLPKLYGRISRILKDRYIGKLRARLPIFTAHSLQEHKRQFDRHEFEVVAIEEFFSSRAGHLWSVFAMQIMRVVSLLKYVKNQQMINVASRVLQLVCMRRYRGDQDATTGYGYLFIVAKKKSVRE